MAEAAKYLMVAAAAIALFTFLTVSHWISTRSAERRERDRLAMLRKIVELPPASAEAMRQLLRDEDVRARALAARKSARARRESMQGGAIIFAVGLGLSIFLYLIVPEAYVWTIGIMLMLVGIVTGGFAYFQPVAAAQENGSRNGDVV
jgi:hypothetical protein